MKQRRPRSVKCSLQHEDLTDQVIGAAIEVHTRLGPGFLEKIYERALDVEFRLRGIPFERQLHIPILYRDIEVGVHRPDYLIDDRIVVELKAIKNLEDLHFAVVRSYLCAADCQHGLLLNFSKTTLEIKRDWTHRDRGPEVLKPSRGHEGPRPLLTRASWTVHLHSFFLVPRFLEVQGFQ